MPGGKVFANGTRALPYWNQSTVSASVTYLRAWILALHAVSRQYIGTAELGRPVHCPRRYKIAI